MMKTFAFISHPVNSEQLRKIWPVAEIIPNFLTAFLSKNILPLKTVEVKRVISREGDEIQGFIIALPLLPEHFLKARKKFVLNKIIAASRMAKEAGASILGLGGCLPAALDIKKSLKIPATTGHAFGAWSIFETVYRVAKAKKLDLKKLNLAIIGATDVGGSLSAQKLAGYVAKIILADTDKDRLEALKRKILDLNQAEVAIEEDTARAVKDSDVVIITKECRRFSLKPEDFKPDSIVCNIALSADMTVKAKPREKITFIEAGLVKLPSAVDFSLTGIWPQDLVSASFAETMLLAFEKRFVNYSWGENTSLDKLEEIADIAMRHGFEVWVPEAPVV